MLFNNNEKKNSNEVKIDKESFTKWWSEGKLDNFEKLKSTIMELVQKKLRDDRFSEVFKCYIENAKKAFQDHYENKFELII